MNLLLVEDNRRISEFMVKGLEESGFSVTLVENGSQARSYINKENWDIIVLDIMLPEIDGFELIQYTRFKKIPTPILIVSALGDPEDKVKALNYGADDYLAKPFHFKEFIARIQALTRRNRTTLIDNNQKLSCKGLKLYIDEHRVERNNLPIELTLQEFKILQILLENQDKVVSRTEIINSVWGYSHSSNTNIVDVYISYLRNKIEFEGQEKVIETVKGRGYIIRSSRS